MSDNNDQWIVINGNPIDGYTFHGTFSNPDDASIWGHDNFDQSGFFVASVWSLDTKWK